jgi:biopolymer transport protein ExbD
MLHNVTQAGWVDHLAAQMIRGAALRTPVALSERLEEEWRSAMSEQPGSWRRLKFALGCWWAALTITHDHPTVGIPVVSAATGGGIMAANAYHPPSLFSRGTAPAARYNALCEINTTPLIDVMLVLLVTLIISLPVMTHAVKLDLPQAPPSHDQPRPEVIDLDIDFDGTVAWNGTPVGNTQQLESYFRAQARKDPQPEIHLRADRRVKYDFVARVLASAQRNRIQKMGFVDTAAFKD